MKKFIGFIIYSFCTIYYSFAMAIDVMDLPLFTINDFESRYKGAFKTDATGFSDGRIAVNNEKNTIFISGDLSYFIIGEYQIPELVNTRTDLSLLNTAKVVQDPVLLLDRIPDNTWSDVPIENRITDLYFGDDNKLYVSGALYYDADTTNKETTFIINNPDDLANSVIEGLYSVQGYQHTNFWHVELPSVWKEYFGYTHLAGGGNNLPIAGRLSIGPSLFLMNYESLTNYKGSELPTQAIIDYNLDHKISDDILNFGGTSAGKANGLQNNDLYTIVSAPFFGFIIPGSRTYAVLGFSGGHTEEDNPYQGTVNDFANLNGTIFYKNSEGTWTTKQGKVNQGYEVYNEEDLGPFYWFFDMKDLVGLDNVWDARPYAYGYYSATFDQRGYPSPIPSGNGLVVTNGYWDNDTGMLYLSVPNAAPRNADEEQYGGPPVILVYDFNLPSPPSNLRIEKNN